MKIAIDFREAGKGKAGKGWYTFNLVRELLELDRENEYILYTAQEENLFGKHKNVRQKNISLPAWKWHYRVLMDLKREKPDIYFAPTSYIIPALAPKNLKTVITVHDLVAFLFPGNHSLKATAIEQVTLKKALKKASAVLVVSENTKKDLLKKFRYPEKQIGITYCAASAEYLRDAPDEKEQEKIRAKFTLPEKFILAVGTIEPRKNFPTLIKSFVVIKRKHPDYKLVIVGRKGWKYREIEETLARYGLRDDVIFPGYLEDSDLHALYAMAAVFVFPSLYEGFGIPPLEAMASGCPVVTSNVASLPEVIGEAGLLIEPNNAAKLAEAVINLIGNDHLRQMFIERGHEQVKKFSWRASAQTVLDVFNSL